jgi:rod shape-determining protein MreD
VRAAPASAGAAIMLSLLAALLLSLLPLPDWAAPLRPPWLIMVLIYWGMVAPHRVGVGVAWLTGLVQDLIQGALLGQHALAYALALYVVVKLHQRLRVYPLWQQSTLVLGLLCMVQLILVWINTSTGRVGGGMEQWLGIALGAALWPWVFLSLRWVRHDHAVH